MISGETQAREWLLGQAGYDSVAAGRIEMLVTLLREENERQNLVSAGSLREVWTRHIADSAQLLCHVPRGTTPWMDLGTGAGFPGLVIAILRPQDEVLMVESRPRRIEWLDRVRTSLGLSNSKVLGARLEDIPTRPVQAISARAFAPLPRLLELSARFSTADTIWLLPKGRSAKQELDALSGRAHMFHVEQSVTDAESGIIVGTLANRKGPRK